jgi:hypothetical protein
MPLCALLPQADTHELREFTPSFLWLLRDFYLKLEDEAGRKVGGRQGGHQAAQDSAADTSSGSSSGSDE